MALATLIAAFHLGNAILDKSFFRSSHLGTALEYAKGPINLLRPVIVGFNATGTPSALEFPLWQAITGLVFKLLGSTWYGWANLVSLILFASGLWPFFQLAKRFVGERSAWWALAFFLAQPLIFIMAGEAATDGFSLVTTIWFLYFAEKMIRTAQARWWFPTALFAGISALSKLPFFMTAGLFSVFILLQCETVGLKSTRFSWRVWFLLGGAGAIALFLMAIWTRYGNALAAEAEYPYVDLRLSHSPFLVFWFFGDLHYRLSPGPWIKGAWRFLHATLGALPMIALLMPALVRRGNRLPKLWLLATILTTLVFTHLVLGHWHYYLMCCPAVAMLCGSTIARFEEWWGAFSRPSLQILLAGVVLVFSTIDGVIAMKIAIDYDYFPKTMSALIREHTQPQDKLILYIADPDWGGRELFRSGRNGLCVVGLDSSPAMPTVKGLHELLASDKDLQRLKQLGYNKLVLISESPVRFAVEAANPGSKRQRRFYPKSISKSVDDWPVVYQSEDLLIKEIP
jgi:hypothetical protein